jgi:DNA-binding MarR family transcriptional regulator
VPVKFIFQNPKMRAWMLLHQTNSSMIKCEDKQFGPLGITTQQHAVLMAVKFSPTPPTLTQIADWVDRHINSITLIVDRMEKSGLVKRVRNTHDRRSFRLMMTAKGEKHLQTGIETGTPLIQEMLNCLTNEELQAMSEFLEKIRTKAIEQCYENKIIREIDVSKNSGM